MREIRWLSYSIYYQCHLVWPDVHVIVYWHNFLNLMTLVYWLNLMSMCRITVKKDQTRAVRAFRV